MSAANDLSPPEKELIATEKTFVSLLGAICEQMRTPLLKNHLIPEPDVDIVFSNVETIANYHKQLLAEMQDGTDLANKLIRMAPFFLNCNTYSQGYEKALKTFSNLSRRNRAFARFIDKALENPAFAGNAINALLILPIQRLMRYHLILTECVKRAPAERKEAYQTALDRVKVIAAEVNESGSRYERMNEVFEKDLSIHALPQTLVEPHRSFIRMDLLRKLTRDGKSQLKYSFLFNDVIVFADEIPLPMLRWPPCSRRDRNSRRRYVFAGSLPLRFVTRVVDKPDGADAAIENNTIELVTEIRTWIIRANSPKQKAEWLRDLQKACPESRLPDLHTFWTQKPHESIYNWRNLWSSLRIVLLVLFIALLLRLFFGDTLRNLNYRLY